MNTIHNEFIEICKQLFKDELKTISCDELNLRSDLQKIEEDSSISSMPFSNKELYALYKLEIRRRKLEKLYEYNN